MGEQPSLVYRKLVIIKIATQSPLRNFIFQENWKKKTTEIKKGKIPESRFWVEENINYDFGGSTLSRLLSI